MVGKARDNPGHRIPGGRGESPEKGQPYLMLQGTETKERAQDLTNRSLLASERAVSGLRVGVEGVGESLSWEKGGLQLGGAGLRERD